MLKFRVLELKRNFSKDDLEKALVELSNCPRNTVVVDNKTLLSEVIFELKRGHLNSSAIFFHWLKEEDISPPLELLWILEKEKLLNITTYLYFNQEYCSSLIFFLCSTLQEDITETEIFPLRTVLLEILNIILNIKNNSDFKFLSEEIIYGFVSEAVSCFDSESLNWNYLRDLSASNKLNRIPIKDFTLLHLEKFLHYEISQHELTFVIGNHKLWCSDKLATHLQTFVEELLSVLGAQTMLEEINNVVQQGIFSWKYLLLIISVFVREERHAGLLKGKVDTWMNCALQEKDKSLLYIALIVGRHCCAEKARYFTNYPTWFGSLPLRSVASFTFFFECLTQIIPDEPPLYLKIHVNKVPSAPANCQALIIDYLTLAKTRLSDLNETTDYIGLFNDYHETDEEGQESDVQRAILLFQETKEIPKPLLEAHVFRRQYYEKVFVKRLLSLSESEDKKRAELIKKLQSVGKIPSALYRSWSARSLSNT